MESAQTTIKIPSIVDTLMDIIQQSIYSLSTQIWLNRLFLIIVETALIKTGRKRRTYSEFLFSAWTGMEGNFEHCSQIYTIWRIYSLMAKYCW